MWEIFIFTLPSPIIITTTMVTTNISFFVLDRILFPILQLSFTIQNNYMITTAVLIALHSAIRNTRLT